MRSPCAKFPIVRRDILENFYKLLLRDTGQMDRRMDFSGIITTSDFLLEGYEIGSGHSVPCSFRAGIKSNPIWPRLVVAVIVGERGSFSSTARAARNLSNFSYTIGNIAAV